MTLSAQPNINAATVQELEALAEKPRTVWRDAWQRIRKSRIALGSMLVIFLYVLIALLAFTPLLGSRIEQTVGGSNDKPRWSIPAKGDAPAKVSPAVWFGTDFLGRSVFWRFLYGSRVALTVAFLASALSIAIGVVLGLLAGFRGGWVDAIIIWLFSTINSIPWILLIMALAFALRGRDVPFLKDRLGEPIPLMGIPTIVIALGLTSWVGLCRLIRGEVIRLRDRDYVVSARALGARDFRILFRHILPNVFHLIIIDFSLGLAAFVQTEVVLSFLGLGVTDQPSWGRMIDDAKLELLKGVWWQMAAATVAIFVFSLAVNIFGDALRDALDPIFAGWIDMSQPLLEVKNLSIAFDTERGQVRPVREVSFSIFPGQTVAVVGESGCGKSVTALSILRLIPQPPGRVLGGEVIMQGKNLLDLSEREMRSVRGKDIAMIFQEPMTSLNPVYTIGDQIAEAIILHQKVSSRKAQEIAEDALKDVGIADPRRRLHEYPHQMSGGMRQRVMIAMALSCQPKLLIADEPTTALDVTIQAQILELLRKLQRERNMAIMLITHDLGVVAENADVVAVMYASRVVEFATVEELFDRPQHPYTEGLFKSVPKLGAHAERLDTIPGTVPNPARFPTGCKFHTRCPRTRRLAAEAHPEQTVEITAAGERFRVLKRCQTDEPSLREVIPRHGSACHQIPHYDQAPVLIPKSDHRREVVPQAVDDIERAVAAKQEVRR